MSIYKIQVARRRVEGAILDVAEMPGAREILSALRLAHAGLVKLESAPATATMSADQAKKIAAKKAALAAALGTK